MADRLGIEAIDREARLVVLKFRPQGKVDPVRLVSLVRQRPELTLVPPSGLKLSLDAARDERGATRPHPTGPAARPARRPGKYGAVVPSWWVARAREAEVKPGFTKAEMTRSAKEDPRAPGGVFEQVGGLLSDLVSGN
jgi:hypothetical protein